MHQALGIAEILLNILQYLPEGELKHTARVNEFWNYLSNRLLYKTTTYHALVNMSENRCKQAARAVESLTFDGILFVEWFTKLELRQLPADIKFPRLKALSVDGEACLWNGSPVRLAEILRHAPLTSLTLKDCDSYFNEQVGDFLKDKSNKLTSLRLTEKSWPLFENFDPLLYGRGGLSEVETLEMTCPQWLPKDLLPFSKCIRDLTLRVDTDNIDFLLLIPNLDLEHLRIEIKIDGFNVVSCRPLSDFPFLNLRTFELKCESVDFADQALEQLLTRLPLLSNLHLRLTGCKFSIALLNAVGQHCRLMESLTLPEGLYDLTQLQHDFPRLEVLDFDSGLLDDSHDPNVVATAKRLEPLFPQLQVFGVGVEAENFYSLLMQTVILCPDRDSLQIKVISNSVCPERPMDFEQDIPIQALARAIEWHRG